MRVHMCILSDQVLQNVLPLCRSEADFICLAASNEMIERGKEKQFIDLLVELGFVQSADKVLVLGGMPSYDFDAIRAWAIENIKSFFDGGAGAKMVLNATGGTKLMSLALIDACRDPELGGEVEIIYCDTMNDQLENIYPLVYMESLAPDLLKTEDIIKAHSIRINQAASDRGDWKEGVEARRELTMHLGENMHGTLGKFIGSMNKALADSLAKNIEETIFPVQIQFGTGVSSDWSYVLRLMADLGLTKLEEEPHPRRPASFTVHSVEAARYLHGIWLEEYLWLCFKDAGISDVQASVEISSLENNQSFKDNELDLIACNRNKLVMVECKTANISRQQVLNQALDKLSALSRKSGGLLAERWFATARWPLENDTDDEGNNLVEKFRAQARADNVVLIEPRHLANLTDRLKRWKKTSRFPLDN